MRLVVDASVALKWLVEEHDTPAALRLLEEGHDLHAPHLIAAEIANALWRKVHRGELERRDASLLAGAVPDMPLRWTADEDLCAGAVRLALELDRPAYDCFYLVLAHRIHGTVVTADARFVRAAAATAYGDALVLLSDERWPRIAP